MDVTIAKEIGRRALMSPPVKVAFVAAVGLSAFQWLVLDIADMQQPNMLWKFARVFTSTMTLAVILSMMAVVANFLHGNHVNVWPRSGMTMLVATLIVSPCCCLMLDMGALIGHVVREPQSNQNMAWAINMLADMDLMWISYIRLSFVFAFSCLIMIGATTRRMTV